MLCPICRVQREKTHEALVLQYLPVNYWRCQSCDFWGTDEPTWLDEAYSSAIASTDTGLVSRNLVLARRVPPLLARMTAPGTANYVDWAGGYGLFVRLMRDRGFNFLWQDDYAENILAGPHVFRKLEDTVSAVTAFEVFEHVPDPLMFVQRVLRETNCQTLIFTTTLHDASYKTDWWYLSPETGQHISFYSLRTLTRLARELGLRLRSYGGLHMLTSGEISSLEYAFLVRTSRFSAPFIVRRLTSKTWADHIAAVSELGNQPDAAPHQIRR